MRRLTTPLPRPQFIAYMVGHCRRRTVCSQSHRMQPVKKQIQVTSTRRGRAVTMFESPDLQRLSAILESCVAQDIGTAARRIASPRRHGLSTTEVMRVQNIRSEACGQQLPATRGILGLRIRRRCGRTTGSSRMAQASHRWFPTDEAASHRHRNGDAPARRGSALRGTGEAIRYRPRMPESASRLTPPPGSVQYGSASGPLPQRRRARRRPKRALCVTRTVRRRAAVREAAQGAVAATPGGGVHQGRRYASPAFGRRWSRERRR